MVKDELSTISVCLLTYNHAGLIDSTLSSILSQNARDFEIIVSDDCSSDGTWEKILKAASFDKRIRPVQTPHNMGMARNANFAVKLAKSRYIALLHHDDLYRHDLLEKWAEVMAQHPGVAFVFNQYGVKGSSFVYSEPIPYGPINGELFLNRYLFRRWGCPVRGTAMIRRSAWDAIGGMRHEFNLLADIDMWMRMAMRWDVGYVPEPLITVREDRPACYPDIYNSHRWSWIRKRVLYEIHAENRKTYFNLTTLKGRFYWWVFRWKLTLETCKWLLYAVVRGKREILATSAFSATQYDLFLLRVIRFFLLKIYYRGESI